ncbi:putative transferase, protein kinase RLK-Pelle-LRR-IX family [Helianthus annuus]|nr:putative transferase, protein kinase RLK-Pelle-LRR-IX family [Helianthus annuus]
MAHHFLLFINFFFFLLISFTTSDDASFMSKLSTSISPTPSTWRTDDFCVWEGIECDNTRHVTAINLVSKSLTGTLPSNLNSLSQLKTLSLQRNSLSGDLPTLANLTFLTEVYLDANNFTSIPSNFFLGLTNLQTFSIPDNLNLSPWSLPNDLSQSTNLQSFQASNANVNGFIPDIFDSFPSFQSLRLSHNNLTGTLPATFGGSGIQNLWLDNQLQGLSGTLDVISSMTQLYQVWLQANAFTGAIPDLSKCINLFDLQLSHNQLTGVVPSSLISLPKLANVTLQNNKLQGPLPVFQNGVRDTLGLSTNRFCLAMPGNCDPQVTALLEVAEALGYPMLLAESWEECDRLKLFKNEISGYYFTFFGKLTSLRSLSLKNNNLIGSIPEILTSLPDLQLLDVSNNNLSGLVPEFPQKVRVVLDNNLLHGEDIHNGSIKPPDSTPNSSASGRSPTQHSQRKLVSACMIVGIVISILVFIWIVSYICYYKFYRVPTKLHSQVSRHHNHTPSYENGSLMISIQVLDQVTDNFSDNNVLGRGGFGVVYKGQFDDGSMIAVKRMKLGTKGIKEFQAEIGVLTEVRHRHLVAFLGYCINGNERLLVYEYMEQGTLSHHLFEWRKHKTPPLSWRQRVSIALDVGRGVEYLHSLAQQRFIHRDLKPANILLDGDMRAKVADFGLVKIVLDGKHSVDTRLAGTFGYLPPEYAGNGRVTRKVDVYAYGVVLMELVTGRKAVDETMSDESCHLATWFRRVPLLSKENMVNCIDQVLNIDDQVTLESIVKVAELAVHCTASDPFQRPDMSYVVNVLGPLVERWEPSQREEVQTYHGHHTSLPRVLQANEDTSSMSSFNDFQANSV